MGIIKEININLPMFKSPSQRAIEVDKRELIVSYRQ